MSEVQATAARRATRRHPYYGDEPVETPLLDQIEREQAERASAIAAEVAQEAVDAEKIEQAQAVLASGKVEALAEAQAKIESLMAEYVETYRAAWTLRREVAAAQSTISELDGEWPSIPPTIALRATVSGEHDLRAVLDAFRLLAMSGGEV